MKKNLLIIVPLYLLDQLTKLWVVRNFQIGDARPVVDGFFELVHVINTGAAFGSFKDGNPFFIGLSVVVLLALAVFYRRGAFPPGMQQTGFALFVAGILGNLTDRLVYRHVVDFLSFDFHVRFANPWPAFNVADSCICVAAVLFALSSVLEKGPGQKAS